MKRYLRVNAEGIPIDTIPSLTLESLTTTMVEGILHVGSDGSVSSTPIVNADVDAAAGIAWSKLANGTANHVLITNGSGVVTSTGTLSETAIPTITTAGKIANSATTATNTNTNSTIVARDSSGNFSAGTITATLNGNASSSTNFSGSLSGDVTGTQGATVISALPDSKLAQITTANKVADSANASLTAATNLGTVSTLVKRDSGGAATLQQLKIANTASSNSAIQIADYVWTTRAAAIINWTSDLNWSGVLKFSIKEPGAESNFTREAFRLQSNAGQTTSQILGANGNTGWPTYSFVNAPTTGMTYNYGDGDTIEFNCSGTAPVAIDSFGLKMSTPIYRRGRNSKTADYTFVDSDDMIAVDCTLGNITITLPQAANCPGRMVCISKVDNSVNTVTISSISTIGGSATYTLSTQYQTVNLIGLGYDKDAWLIMGKS